jgi:signal transduction histidine kinase
VIRPLSDVASAARAISLGDLQTRLPDTDRDLTPLTSAFNDMATALESRIEHETRFTSDVSHELRTPLTAITSAVQLARRSEDPDRTQLALDVVDERVDHLRKLVLDLLEISRFDVGAVELDVEPTDVVALVAGTAESVGVRGEVIVDETNGDRSLLLDRRRIDRVLANLLVNSQQYGGGPTRILVSIRHDTLTLAVDDAGPGVSPDEREAIFGRFHRGRAANSPDAPVGTGLGLAIAEEHVHFHGGTIGVEASAYGGARFVVSIPAKRP